MLDGLADSMRIVIVGLNNAGKTTILYNLHLGQAGILKACRLVGIFPWTFTHVQLQVGGYLMQSSYGARIRTKGLIP